MLRNLKSIYLSRQDHLRALALMHWIILAVPGQAAEVRDRGATDDPDGPKGSGRSYWPEVAWLLRESYRSLKAAVSDPQVGAR